MRLVLLIFVFTSFARASINDDVKLLISALSEVLDFIESHYYQINFDGLLGVVIAESQLLQVVKYDGGLKSLILKCRSIKGQIEPILPNYPTKYRVFKKYLLKPTAWVNNKVFVKNDLKNLGLYKNWTAKTLLDNRSAAYKGVPTDVCMLEILEQSSNVCHVSPFCFDMMLAERVDSCYLLTHRLLFLQIASRIKSCSINQQLLEKYSNDYCSLMLKEAKTNKRLGFPQHDIVLEQILFCGLEGYEEFLSNEFRSLVLKWKTLYGCYKPDYVNVSKRTANRIDFGCTDHATGLGAAALGLNLRYLLQKTVNAY